MKKFGMSVISTWMSLLVAVAGGLELPVYSRDVLRLHLLEQVRGGYIVLWAPTMEPAAVWVEVNGGSIREVLGLLSKEEFVFRVKNPDEKISGYADLRSESGEILFVGSISFSAKELSSGNLPVFRLMMSDRVWITVPGAKGVEISAALVFQREDGSTERTDPLNVDTKEGRILFPTRYAGATGVLLTITGPQGESFTQRLSEAGGSFAPLNKTDSIFVVADHYFFDDPSVVEVVGMSGMPPTAEILLTAERIVKFSVKGFIAEDASYEVPYAMVLIKDGEVTEYPFGDRFQIRLPKGRYQVFWRWTRFNDHPDHTESREEVGGKG